MHAKPILLLYLFIALLVYVIRAMASIACSTCINIFLISSIHIIAEACYGTNTRASFPARTYVYVPKGP